MPCLLKSAKLSVALALATFAVPGLTPAQHYTQKNLVSDISQPNNADGSAVLVDPNLKNPWGLTRSSGSPWWVANNNSGTSTLYTGAGVPPNAFPDPHPDSNGNGINSPFNNFVMVPPPAFAPGTQSAPTGVVFNGSPTDFLVAPGKQAIFIFSTEDGTISGWNPGVDVTNAIRKVDNSDKGSKNSAVYKGMTSAEINGKRFLYVTNFRSGRVEVYDTNFHRVHLGDDAFDDDSIPRDFAPFNVQNIGGSLFVTYARQDAARHDPVLGDGGGFVDIFSTDGKLQGRLENGWFNAPWGVVWTPRDFGEFSNTILVGNFRSGWIAAFNGFTKKFIGFVRNDKDNSLVFIDGIWSLTFGNNGGAGSSTTLFFTAGPNLEKNGLFGTLTPVTAEQDGDEE
jgi:uncharacterized protein (TIGR03118 family)